MNPKRLFVAVSLPDAVKTKIHEWTKELRKELPFKRWVHPDDVHLTLKFLGETAPEKIDEVIGRLEKATFSTKPFTLQLDTIGTFGSPHNPTVLWLGVQGELSLLHKLQQEVETSLTELGFRQDDRPFRPHLTLARRFSGEYRFSNRALSQATVQSDPLSWKVDRIVLYESRLGERPMYRVLREFVFQS
jgi:2'-5' RNA ligase